MKGIASVTLSLIHIYGQTLPQPGVFQNLVKKSVNLPEIHTEEDEWYCNRLVNDCLLYTSDIPKNYLCPPIPGRADYIHYIADLIGSEAVSKAVKVENG